MHTLWQDLRYGARMLSKKPGFTLIAVITLALGIGANTAIFSVVNAALLRPLPYRDPERLVFLSSARPNGARDGFSFQEFNEFREQSGTLESLSAETTQSVNLTGVKQPDFVRGAFVSANFFETFKIAPLVGRTFAKGEDGAGAERVVVVSQSLWQSRLNGDPNLEGKKLIRGAPLSQNGGSLAVVLPDRERPPNGGEPRVYFNTATAGYFETMAIPLLRGRLFNEQDAGDRPLVFLVNQAMASKLWPNEDPIGKEIQLVDGATTGAIIGVVGDSKQRSLTETQSAQMYSHYGHMPGTFATIVVRTTVEPMDLSQAVREAVWKVDPDQPMWAIRTVERMMDSHLAGRRFLMILMGVFAALAMVLAAVGIYGVVSHAVSQSIREIGIRMVFGAQRRDVLLMVIAHGMKLVVIGVALGLLAALGLKQWMTTLLYDVRPTDPATFAVVALLLTAAALLACYLPARRATKTDPMNAIRHE